MGIGNTGPIRPGALCKGPAGLGGPVTMGPRPIESYCAKHNRNIGPSGPMGLWTRPYGPLRAGRTYVGPTFICVSVCYFGLPKGRPHKIRTRKNFLLWKFYSCAYYYWMWSRCGCLYWLPGPFRGPMLAGGSRAFGPFPLQPPTALRPFILAKGQEVTYSIVPRTTA